MTPLSSSSVSARTAVRAAREWHSREPTLARTVLLALVCTVPLLLLALVDDRTINGVSVWLKPIKFHVAIALYLGTLTWYAGWIDRRWRSRTWYRLFVALLVLCTVVELAWLSAAAVVGVPSHFNRSDPVFAALYPLMGVLAVTLTSGALFYAVLIERHRPASLAPSRRIAVTTALAASFALTVLVAGTLSSMDSHWIDGTRSDAAGLPLFGWSRDGGDLRAAHFFALHAMQLVPLAVWLAWPSPPYRGGRVGAVLVTLGYSLFVVALYRDALGGEPFL